MTKIIPAAILVLLLTLHFAACGVRGARAVTVPTADIVAKTLAARRIYLRLR